MFTIQPRRHLLNVACVLLTGCGVADYQAQMVQQQARVQYLDEEAKHVGGPIRLPDKREGEKEGDQVPANELFLRVPKGVATEAEAKALGGGVYAYKGSSESGGLEMFVAAAKGDRGKNRDAFRSDVLRALGVTGGNYVMKEIDDKVTRRKFDVLTADRLYVHFYQDEMYQVAVAFRVPAGATKDAAEVNANRMNYTLGTLVVGNAAGRRHDAVRRKR